MSVKFVQRQEVVTIGTKADNKIYDVAIYCRLSKEDAKDGREEENSSIGTQKFILTEYVRQRGWHLVQIYVDDDYSGTNFNRPSFQNMIKDIEAGRINCVLTKDLSRLGRNYLDCGLYLEVFFPEHGVRYNAVNDGVDTLNKNAMDITPFRNILNEMYAADISVKVKSSLRARFNNGLYVSTVKSLEREQRKLTKRLAELDKLFSALYEDRVLERITDKNFDMVSRKYEKEQLEITARMAEIQKILSEKGKSDSRVKDFFSLIANYADTVELTAAMVNALIDKITIGERVKREDGTVEQVIKIHYKFVGDLSNELHITPTKRYATLPPYGASAVVPSLFLAPGCAKYCKSCAAKIRQQRCNESKRRSREAKRQEILQSHSFARERLCAPINPIHCQCCGVEFLPNSSRGKYCPSCGDRLRLERARENSRRKYEAIKQVKGLA